MGGGGFSLAANLPRWQVQGMLRMSSAGESPRSPFNIACALFSCDADIGGRTIFRQPFVLTLDNRIGNW